MLAVDPDADETKIISDYYDELNVIEHQDKIEMRKDKCMVCYFGAIGRQTLENVTKKLKG